MNYILVHLPFTGTVLGITQHMQAGRGYTHKRADEVHHEEHAGTTADFTIERSYRQHLALLRFVRDDASASERGELYNLFREWVTNTYPAGLTEHDWEGIMTEDATSSLSDDVSDSGSSAGAD